MPIAATSHSVAAVVSPRTESPCRMIAPAPRKPIPVTICAAIRVGSTLTPKLAYPYAETSVNSAAPTDAQEWGTKPPCRSRSSRSSRIAPPSAAATNRRRSTSAQPIVCVTTSALGELTRDRLCLQRRDLADPGRGELEQLVERLAREGVALGSRLHLHEAPVAGHDDVHVGVGARVLGVVEVEQRRALHDTDRDGGDRVAERARETEAIERAHRGHVRAANRRATGAPVGLEDVAVEPQRPFAERLEVGDRADGAADQPLDLDGPPLLLAARGLPLDALAGGGRQERVLRGDPAAALVAEPARHVLVDHGRAQHLRAALRDHDRPVRVLEVIGLEGDPAQLGVLAAALARAHAAAPSSVATVTCSTSRTGSWRKRRPSSRKASGSPVVRKR